MSESFYSETVPLLRPELVTGKLNRRPVYVYAVIAAMGGFVCGYDTGSISSIIALPLFQARFFTDGSLAYYASILLASYLTTSMCGAFISGYFCDRIGRKRSMLLASFFLILGILYELLGLNSFTLLLGRLVGGMGTGLMTNAVPLYQSEIAPPDIRGRLISIFSLLGSLGQMVGYFVTFYSSHASTHWCWRAPWVVQLIACVVFAVCLCFIPYSPRWLIDKGRYVEALSVLSRLHNLPKTHITIQKEFNSCKNMIEAEKMDGMGRSYIELFHGTDLKRTLCSFFISIATCFTGNVVVAYYAPQIFKNAGMSDVSTSLALTGGIGLLSLVFTALSLQWAVDMWGRKALFLAGSAVSTVCMLTVGLIFYFFASLGPDGSAVIVSDPIATGIIIACIYLLSASFAGTWGVTNYVYTAEIFSMRCRVKGLSLTYAISWAGSIIITYCTPFFMACTVSGVYFFFTACSLLTFIGVVMFIPETKGKTLEEIDLMFSNKNK